MIILFCLISQAVIWCGYSLVLYLSHHDHSFYETILMFMFAYFGYLVALRLIQNTKLSILLSLSAASIYLIGRIVLFTI
ncbi:hypothetical protein [Fictibacillus barbaricus]|uniref:CHASE2 domain-containing sensor protein n=1 Tax=Fictibacillus barbaricus TaxID=182136 RepID=A0ABU1TXZ4_9BACL|nr:hypothetical protein [Fictibacillus barbaricus]MDR7072087.1 CHASE2 domain-containing sensor protein [Fictibacillus barbaricus]